MASGPAPVRAASLANQSNLVMVLIAHAVSAFALFAARVPYGSSSPAPRGGGWEACVVLKRMICKSSIVKEGAGGELRFFTT